MGPPPSVDDGLESAPLFSDPTDLDFYPTHRLQRLDPEEFDLESDVQDDPLIDDVTPEEPSTVDEPPELPEPPVQFYPPEMTMPPRLPDQLVRGTPDLAEDDKDPDTGERSQEHRLGTPALPDMTPTGSSTPGGREGQTTGRITDRPSDPGGFESAVVSKVVAMSPAMMQLSPASDLELERPEDSRSWPPADSGLHIDSQVTSLKKLRERESDRTGVWQESRPETQRRRFESAKDVDKIMTPAPPGAKSPSPKDTPESPDEDIIADRYKVLERIGMGGMARIFKVQHVELGKEFALKIIHSALSEDEKVREMFYQEARLASSMDHPNIVLLTDFGVDVDYGAFIVMEYLKGETLHARLRREGRLHVNAACEVALHVAEALHFIHSKNVVHCDIKADNVFLCRPPPEQRRRTIVKLLDFGLSRQELPSGKVSVSEVGGTPAYMAPERINRAAPRPAMDIYSLGVLLYEMLTGKLPFSGTLEEVLVAQIQTPPVPPSKRMPEPLDEAVEELVLKALRKQPEERQRDMGAFIYEIRTVMDMLGIGRHRVKRIASGRDSALSARLKNCELMVADCPLPLFMANLQGVLLLANQAFASFVNVTPEQANGMSLADTRLGRICPEIFEDIDKVAETRKAAQRILSFPWRSAKQVSMMIWLGPVVVGKQILAVTGVVHPFNTTSG